LKVSKDNSDGVVVVVTPVVSSPSGLIVVASDSRSIPAAVANVAGV
jgi:hypothetical protein